MSDPNEQKLPDLIAKSGEEFFQLCKSNPNKKIHWLPEASGQWVWKKSQGSLDDLRKYIDNQITSYSPKHTNGFLGQTKEQKVMFISDTAGMGKTTVLTHLRQLKIINLTIG